jgi:hypothetical protein
MGRWVHDNVLDASLNLLRNNTQAITVNSTRPATRAEALSTYMIVKTTTVTSTWFTAAANSSASGRKVEIKAKTGLTPSSSGTADHVSLVNATSSKVLYVTKCGIKALTTSDTVSLSSWGIHILDPSSST